MKNSGNHFPTFKSLSLPLFLLFALPAAAAPLAAVYGPDAECLTPVFADAGYQPAVLSPEDLRPAAGLATTDLLVLSDAGHLPAGSTAAIHDFLKRGGDIIALRAPLWREPLVKWRDKWAPIDTYAQDTATELPANVLCGFLPEEIAAGSHSATSDDGPSVYESVQGPAQDQHALHVKLTDFKNWDNLAFPPFDQPFRDGKTLTVFAAKGNGALMVEWQEKDGSRWIATAPLTPEWRRHVLTPSSFKFWESVPVRAQDKFHPENATRLIIGMANSHGGSGGSREYWVGPIGTDMPSEDYAPAVAREELPRLDILSPAYKFFECTHATQIDTASGLPFMSPANFGTAAGILSMHPRPTGAGFDKGRTWRWIPLMQTSPRMSEIRNAGAVNRGTCGAILFHADGPYKGGRWASIGVQDAEWYQSEQFRKALEELARSFLDGVHILDGGADFYTYFDGQEVRLGVRAAASDNCGSVTDAPARGLIARVLVYGNEDGAPLLYDTQWPLKCASGTIETVSAAWTPKRWPARGCRVVAQLLRGNALLDEVSHDIHVWRPKERKQFMTVKDGDFFLDGRRWRANGVNYMPSTGIGVEDQRYFEFWLSAESYDPQFIETDLARMASIGVNAVSIFLYHDSIDSQNLLDLLRRLDLHCMKANLSLRPGTPFDFEWPKVREMIERYRLAENDTVFAYDLAWEPMWMRYDDRKRWDAEWESWVVERYGGIDNAERDWAYPIPRDDDARITNPGRDELMTDGEWRRMASAYRRFLDTTLYRYYSKARALVLDVDPNHLVSFRMTEAGDPTMNWDDVLPYDFPYLAAAVDILEPEGYGRIGDWEKVKPGWFEFEYARWAAPHLPMIWAEAGVSAWDHSAGKCTDKSLAVQGRYYRDFYRMMTASGADGIFWWWYPGGLRVNENSDYGIFNPDGTDRPATQAIRDCGREFIDGPDAKPVDTWLEVDRDARADGVVGIYKSVGDQFWKLLDEDKIPGLRTACTGTDSGNCPLIAVGNTPCNGSNPPKCLDGLFDKTEFRSGNDDWTLVEKNGQIKVTPGQPLHVRITATNLGEASWRYEGPGRVQLTVSGAVNQSFPISGPVPHFGTHTWSDIEINPQGFQVPPAEITFSLNAESRTPFGEKFKITLVH